MLLAEFAGHAGIVTDVEFSADGNLLASAGTDAYVNLWDVTARRLSKRFRAHYKSAQGVCFSPDGKRLASFGTIRDSSTVWDLETLRPLVVFPWENRWHIDGQFSPDGSTLVRFNTEGIVEFWHAPSFAELEAAERAKAPPEQSP